jgi:hypothetical protein
VTDKSTHLFSSNQEKCLFAPIEVELRPYFEAFKQRNLQLLPDAKKLNKDFHSVNSDQKVLSFTPQNNEMSFQNLGYEERIYHHGLIATRSANWHDFFNALIWKAYPKTKSALNRIHHQEITQQASTLRSRKRDLLTLFDECGVVVFAEDELLGLIRQHKWHALFVENKQKWQDKKITVITFGHAMYEKYLNPYIGMTAQALLLNPVDCDLDTLLCSGLTKQTLLRDKKELSPLPILGIPGWYKPQDKQFYGDSNYFRGKFTT